MSRQTIPRGPLASINAKANGVWEMERGTVVQIIDRSPSGRASRVLMPKDPQRLVEKAGKLCWIPTSWLDEEETDE